MPRRMERPVRGAGPPPLRLAAAFLLVVGLTGCSGGRHHPTYPYPDALPGGSPLHSATLTPGDAWLRHHLMFGNPDSALAVLDPTRRQYSSDDVLRALQESIVLRQAGDYTRSNERLEWADQETERRSTRSLSRTAGSLLISDRVLFYSPSAGEQAMIPYYRMMNYLALGDVGGATVEARRLSAVLGAAGGRETRRCAADGILQYLAGLVFEVAGEGNDALVALRRAERSFDSCEVGRGIERPESFGRDLYRVASANEVVEVADSALSRYAPALEELPPGAGEVVLIVERGFVAHLTEESLHVAVGEDELDRLDSGDRDGISAVAAVVASRLLGTTAARRAWGASWDDDPSEPIGHASSGSQLLRLAWPALRQEPLSEEQPLRVLLDSDTIEFVRAADISSVLADELEAARPAATARLVARALTKYLVARELERKAEKEGGEFLGFVAGRLATHAANEMERADLRSWTLLPNEITMVRLALPEGRHELRVQIISERGEPPVMLRFEPVEVRAGGVSFVNQRVWPDGTLVSGRIPEPGDRGAETASPQLPYE
jgi:uncharacterized protein